MLMVSFYLSKCPATLTPLTISTIIKDVNDKSINTPLVPVITVADNYCPFSVKVTAKKNGVYYAMAS